MASMSDSPAGHYVLLTAPDDAPATVRHTWDLVWKHVLRLPDPPPQEDVRPHAEPAIDVETPPRRSAVDVNEPLPKWNLSDVDHNTIADPRNDVPQPYIRASGSSGIPSGDESGQYVMVESSAPSSGRSTQSAWKFSGYRVKLMVDQPVSTADEEVFGRETESVPYDLLIDTGSNYTWILGRGYREVKTREVNSQQPAPAAQSDPTHPPASASSPPTPSSLSGSTAPPGDSNPQDSSSASTASSVSSSRIVSYTLDWIEKPLKDERDVDLGVVRPQHSTLLNPDFEYVDKGLNATDHYSLTYGASAFQAELVLCNTAERVELSQSCDWNRKKSSFAFLNFYFRFAAAAAVSYQLDRNPVDGVLGLGLTTTQYGFRTRSPSFLSTIKDYVKQTRERPYNAEGGLIIYLALRQLHWRTLLLESWMAFNTWPSPGIPQWSRPIQVIQSGSGTYFHWALSLLGMSVVKRIGQDRYEDVPHGNLLPPGVGVGVIIDTGCSASYVSDILLSYIRMSLYPCAQNTKLEEDAMRLTGVQPQMDHGLTFVVPDDQYDDNLFIRYRFQGRSAGFDVVEVYGPADPFLCAHNPHDRSQDFREGLLFSYSTLKTVTDDRWIFGLNFLHSMFAALHIPAHPTGARPYVRLAPQHQSDKIMRQFSLPPFSS